MQRGGMACESLSQCSGGYCRGRQVFISLLHFHLFGTRRRSFCLDDGGTGDLLAVAVNLATATRHPFPVPPQGEGKQQHPPAHTQAVGSPADSGRLPAVPASCQPPQQQPLCWRTVKQEARQGFVALMKQAGLPVSLLCCGEEWLRRACGVRLAVRLLFCLKQACSDIHVHSGPSKLFVPAG